MNEGDDGSNKNLCDYEVPQAQPSSIDLNSLPTQQAYDNEWIKFLLELAKNSSTKDIIDFIERTKWTDRQKNKIMTYCRVVLGRGLSTTYITSHKDYLKVLDDFEEINCDLYVGLTRFDINPEFLMLISLVKLHFNLELRRSKHGFLTMAMKTQRNEVVQEDANLRSAGLKNKITNFFGGNE